jgi:hypothetical protein
LISFRPSRPARKFLVDIVAFVFLVSITGLGYFAERSDTIVLLLVFLLAFGASLIAYRLAQTRLLVRQLLVVAVLARVALIPMMPNLSDDIYRFVWDGRLLYQGYDPFAYLPSEIMRGEAAVNALGIDPELYDQLNSPNYYTIYPPVNQAVFALAAWFSPTSVRGNAIIIRLIIVAAELLTLWLLIRLLNIEQGIRNDEFRSRTVTTSSFNIRHSLRFPVHCGRSGIDIHFLRTVQNEQKRPYQPPPRAILLYALNPLVIIELTGNLHFEALMITFVLGSVYLLRKRKIVGSGVALALAVCTKLIPLIFLPLYLRRLGWKRAMLFYAVVGGVTVLLFFPLATPELLAGMHDSVGLYFQKFEFNASVYYLVREVGFYQKGYNIIQSAGRWLAISTFLIIMLYALRERERQLLAAFGWVWLIFLLLSTTVHPWYVTPLLALTAFTPYRYALLWSGLVFFSYVGYRATGFSENLWVTMIEYGAVVGMLVWEVIRWRRRGFVGRRPEE